MSAAPTGTSWSIVVKNYVVRFMRDESGATAIEYGLIAALIAVGIIAASRSIGSQISSTFNTIKDTMANG
jgi:pilus assembly protein Flp/PilA